MVVLNMEITKLSLSAMFGAAILLLSTLTFLPSARAHEDTGFVGDCDEGAYPGGAVTRGDDSTGTISVTATCTIQSTAHCQTTERDCSAGSVTPSEMNTTLSCDGHTTSGDHQGHIHCSASGGGDGIGGIACGALGAILLLLDQEVRCPASHASTPQDWVDEWSERTASPHVTSAVSLWDEDTGYGCHDGHCHPFTPVATQQLDGGLRLGTPW